MTRNTAITTRCLRRFAAFRLVPSNIGYFLRIPRTTRSAVRLIANVTTKSRIPRVNSTL